MSTDPKDGKDEKQGQTPEWRKLEASEVAEEWLLHYVNVSEYSRAWIMNGNSLIVLEEIDKYPDPKSASCIGRLVEGKLVFDETAETEMDARGFECKE